MTYDNILRFADDPDVRDPIKFLREREIVHFQRFGEGLRILTDQLDSKNFYALIHPLISGNHPKLAVPAGAAFSIFPPCLPLKK